MTETGIERHVTQLKDTFDLPLGHTVVVVLYPLRLLDLLGGHVLFRPPSEQLSELDPQRYDPSNVARLPDAKSRQLLPYSFTSHPVTQLTSSRNCV